MLIASGLRRGKFAYADIAEDIMGSPGAVAVNIIVALDCAGAICVFYKYMAGSVHVLGTSMGYDFSEPVLIAIISFLVVFPLSVPERITAIQYAATASIVPLAVVIGVVVFRSPYLASEAQVNQILVRTDLASTEAAQSCSAVFFSFMCHMNVWAIRNELSNNVPRRTSKVFRRAALILFFVYAIVAVAGAVSFGDSTPPNILKAYPASDAMNVCAHVLMSGMLVVCSVLCVHPVRRALAGLCGYDVGTPSAECHQMSPGLVRSPVQLMSPSGDSDNLPLLAAEKTGTKKRLTRFGSFLITFLVILSTCTVAIAVPSIVELLGVLGGFCAVALMFVFPTFFYAKTQGGWRTAFAVFIATIFSAIGLIAAVGSMMPQRPSSV